MLFCCIHFPWRNRTVWSIVADEVSIESCGYLSGDDRMRFCPNMLHTSMVQIHCLSEGLCFTINYQSQNPDGYRVSTAEMNPWTPFRIEQMHEWILVRIETSF